MENQTHPNSKANRILYIVFAILLIGSIAFTFWRLVIQKDYQIIAETSCDPQTENCFVRTCSPEDDNTCPTNEAERSSYYKQISKNASTIYACEQTTEKLGCNEELTCLENEANCAYTLCSADAVPEGESCSQ